MPKPPRAATSGNVFIVVAPSGAGKSSLIAKTLEGDDNIVLSISCTTRPRRPGEVNNRDYRFVTEAEFLELRDTNQLLEWARVHSNYYGTPKDAIDTALQNGQDILLEIDWQGARQVRRYYPQAIGIFILPPSIAALKTRLETRGQDSPEVIAQRLLAAGGEISHAGECEYVIINQEFSVALQQLSQIIQTARLRYENQAHKHAQLFSELGIN